MYEDALNYAFKEYDKKARTMDQIRKAAGEITSSLPEKIYTRKDVKLVVLDILKKLEEVEK